MAITGNIIDQIIDRTEYQHGREGEDITKLPEDVVLNDDKIKYFCEQIQKITFKQQQEIIRLENKIEKMTKILEELNLCSQCGCELENIEISCDADGNRREYADMCPECD